MTALEHRAAARRGQAGVAAVEFALVATVFFTMLFGGLEFGRLLWMWNAAAEATRLGARMAVVCDMNASQINVRMRERLAVLGDANIVLAYTPAGCSAATCQAVTVSLQGYVAKTFIPFVSINPTLQGFQTTLSREYMTSAGNPACS